MRIYLKHFTNLQVLYKYYCYYMHNRETIGMAKKYFSWNVNNMTQRRKNRFILFEKCHIPISRKSHPSIFTSELQQAQLIYQHTCIRHLYRVFLKCFPKITTIQQQQTHLYMYLRAYIATTLSSFPYPQTVGSLGEKNRRKLKGS